MRRRPSADGTFPSTPTSKPTRKVLPASGVLLALAALMLTTVLPLPAAAQLPCVECAVKLSIVDWNGTAAPETIAVGTLRVTNDGDATDSYTITVTVDNETWTGQSEPTEIKDVPPGKGVFASSENSATFSVRVLVPAMTRANAATTVTVTATSQNSEGLKDEVTLEARAKQVYGWTMDCTETLEVQKSKRAEVVLEARNTGNGADRGTLTYTGVEGIVVSEPKAFDLGPGRQKTQTLEIGVGLRAEDGDYTIRWDLISAGDPETRADCTTVFTVTGGTPDGTDGGDSEDEDSPGAGVLLVALLPIVLALQRTRRRP